MKASAQVGIILVSTVMAFAAILSAPLGVGDAGSNRCSATAFDAAPIAVIKDLPEFVSNGTPTPLDGSQSYDPDGNITSYSWKISVTGLSTNLTGISITYIFTVLDEYTIELTVTDNESKTSTDTEVVNAVTDSDDDDLPDWWEQKYFGNLAQGPGDDYDSDGYLNSEELEDGTNPAQKDAGPSMLSKIPIWGYAAIAAGVAAVVFVILWPKLRKRRKEKEKQKIQYALEIEKALEEEK